MIDDLGKKALIDLAAPLAKDVLPKLALKATSSVLGKFERKIRGRGAIATIGAGAVRVGIGFNLFISCEDMDNIIKIVESLKKSGLLIDGGTETVKHEMKEQEGRSLGAMMTSLAASLIAPMAFSLINAVTRKGVRRAGRRQEGGHPPSLSLSLMIKAMSGKGVPRDRKWYNMDHVHKSFKFRFIL